MGSRRGCSAMCRMSDGFGRTIRFGRGLRAVGVGARVVEEGVPGTREWAVATVLPGARVGENFPGLSVKPRGRRVHGRPAVRHRGGPSLRGTPTSHGARSWAKGP